MLPCKDVSQCLPYLGFPKKVFQKVGKYIIESWCPTKFHFLHCLVDLSNYERWRPGGFFCIFRKLNLTAIPLMKSLSLGIL